MVVGGGHGGYAEDRAHGGAPVPDGGAGPGQGRQHRVAVDA